MMCYVVFLTAVQNVNPNVTPVHGTYGLGIKRPLPQQPQQPQQHIEDTSPKRRRVETENEGEIKLVSDSENEHV